MTFRLPFFKPANASPSRREDVATKANNPNLYTNPIPTFNPVVPRVQGIRTALNSLVVLPLNLCLFTNPIPFKQTDWAPVKPSVRQATQHVQTPLNLNLFTNPTPFQRVDWNPAERPPQPAQQVQPYNLALLSQTAAAPFSQTDWSKVSSVKFSLAHAPQNTLVNLLAPPVIVVGTEKLRAPYLSRVYTREIHPAPVTGPNIALAPTVVGSPFTQTDWPRVSTPRIAAGDIYNVVLFDGSVPFNKLDWGQVEFPPPRAPDQQYYNLALRSQVVVAAPFYQTDWPLARRLKPQATDITLDLDLNRYTNPIPFNQLDWSKTVFQTPRAPDQQNYNLALSFVFVQPPFAQYDWSKTVFQTPRLPDASVRLNLNLYQNPIPFSQLDWSKTVFQTPRLPDPSVPSNLVLNPPPLPPPPEFSVATPPDNSAVGDIIRRKKKKRKLEEKTAPPVIRRAVYERIVEKPEEVIEERAEERVEEVKAEPFKGSLLDLAPLPAEDPRAALKRKQQEEEEIALYLLGFK